jgi:hypothetical protein
MNRREEKIVRTLANSVRVMTVVQVARTWWADTRSGRNRAAAALNRLDAEGWVHVQRVLSRPIQSLASPLIRWRPSQEQPDFEAAARSLHRRAMADARSVKVVFASSRAVIFFAAGRAPALKITQMTHDLNVSELYLHFRRSGLPEGCWVSEDRLPRNWPLRQRPDALLRNEAGDVARAIEYGGDYPPRRLAALHAGLSRIGLGYEIW